MSKKTNKAVISGQATIKNPRTTLYGRIEDAIKDVINLELTEPQAPTRLSDIKLTGLKGKLGKVNTSDVDIDTEAIAKALKNNADKVKVFVENHGNWFLSHTKTYQLPRLEVDKNGKLEWVNKNNYKALKSYFKPETKTHTYTADDIEKQQKRYAEAKAKNDPNAEMYKPAKVGEGWTIKGVKITDYEGFIEAIKATVPKSNRRSIYDPSQDPNADFGQLDPVLLEFSKLAREIGIEPSGDLVFRETKNIKTRARQVIYRARYTEPSTNPDIITTDIRESDRLVYSYVLYAIVGVKEQAERKKKKTTEFINLKDDGEYHPTLFKPVNAQLQALLEQKALQSVGNMTSDELADKNNYEVSANPQSSVIKFTAKDPKTAQIMVRTRVAEYYDFLLAIQEYEYNHPYNTEAIPLRALAELIPRRAESIKKDGYYRPDYRRNDYQVIKELTEISFKVPTKRYKNGDYKRSYVYILKQLKGDRINKNGEVMAVNTGFTDEYNALKAFSLAVLLEKLSLLGNDAIAKVIAGFIADRFTAQLPTVLDSNPIPVRIETLLKKGVIDANNPTAKNNTLKTKLDKIADVGFIEKWNTKAYAENTETDPHKITTKNKATMTVYVYPPKLLLDLGIDKKRRQAIEKAYKDEQALYRQELKDLVALYRKDQLINTKGTKYKEILVEDMTEKWGDTVTVDEVDLMLYNKKEISDNFIDEVIRPLTQEYEPLTYDGDK